MLSKQRTVLSSSKINGDVSRPNFILHKWIEENYGKKCSDYERGCACCEAWDCYDILKLFVNDEEESNGEKIKLENKKRAVEKFFDRIKDYPEAVDYLKKLILYTNNSGNNHNIKIYKQ